MAPWTLPDAIRRNNIDFLRFFLASLVILAHSYALPLGNDSTEPLYRFSHGQRTFGGLAVDFFFILSGFLITHSWLRSRGLWTYLWNRVLRIYPAFIAASLLGLFVIAPLFGGAGTPSPTAEIGEPFAGIPIWRVALHLVNLSGGDAKVFSHNPVQAVNGSLWTVRYEFWCYLGVAALGLATLLSKKPKWVLGLFVVSVLGSVAYSLVYIAHGKEMNIGRAALVVGYPEEWYRLLPCYLAGMAFYLFKDRIPWHPGIFVAACAMLAAGCVVPHGMSVASPIAGAYVLFSLAFSPALPLQNFGKFGDFSYGIYAYAFPIQQALVAKLGVNVSVWTLCTYSFAITLVVAILSWYAVEKPFLKLKKRSSHPPRSLGESGA